MESILGNTRKPDITFYANGRIDITANLVRTLNLKHGDVIDIAKDEEEFYLYVKYRAPLRGRHEAAVYPTNKSSHNFRTYSHNLTTAILRECSNRLKVRLCVGESVRNNDRLFIPIITKNLL